MSSKYGKRYSAGFKFQVILEALKGSKTTGQIARSYEVHPITLTRWMKEFMEKGPELFSQETTIHEYEKRIRELERLIGHKEMETALLKNFLSGSSAKRKNIVI